MPPYVVVLLPMSWHVIEALRIKRERSMVIFDISTELSLYEKWSGSRLHEGIPGAAIRRGWEISTWGWRKGERLRRYGALLFLRTLVNRDNLAACGSCHLFPAYVHLPHCIRVKEKLVLMYFVAKEIFTIGLNMPLFFYSQKLCDNSSNCKMNAVNCIMISRRYF